MTIAILVILLAAPMTATEEASGPAVARYITELLAKHPPGIGERYADTFAELNAAMRRDVKSLLPSHRFVVAELFYSHWVPDDGTVKMLLVIEASSGKVTGHCWAPWYAGHSESFARMLETYEPLSEREALRTVRLLAEAIAATAPGFTVGEATLRRGVIETAMIQNGKPWRILRVRYQKGVGFGRLVLRNPITGEDDQATGFDPITK